MAGGGINLSPDEHAAIRRLSRGDLADLLTALDEAGGGLMIGGGINLTPAEHDALRRLSRGDLANLLTVLDEDGWREAQTLLRRLDARGGYIQQTEGGNP